MTTQELSPKDERVEIVGPGDLALRQLWLEDALVYFELINEDRANFKYGEEVAPNKYQTIEDVIESILHPDPRKPGRLRFGIWDGEKMVGSINLTPGENDPSCAEVGYWVGGKYIGHGYATSAVELLSKHALENWGYERLIARVNIKNEASIRVLQKAGYHLSGEPHEPTVPLYELHKPND